jgi:hypothetical protein
MHEVLPAAAWYWPRPQLVQGVVLLAALALDLPTAHAMQTRFEEAVGAATCAHPALQLLIGSQMRSC